MNGMKTERIPGQRRYDQRRGSRKGAADAVTKALLGAILIVLLVILVVVLWPHGEKQNTQRGPSGGNTPIAKPGEKVPRPSEAPAPPLTVGSPDRIRDVLQEGKTYEVITTAEITAPARDKQWGFQRTIHVAYRAEMRMRRTIEKNDGHRVVELRHILEAAAVKVASQVEVRFVPTEPGSLLLGALVALLDATVTGGGASQLAPAVIQGICVGYQAGTEYLLDQANTKVTAAVDSLKGKKVRITFVDGQGVVELEPVDCELTEEERDLLMASAVVTDAYLLPDMKSQPGDVWDVDGRAFSDFLPPSWRGTPRGKVSIRREKDFQENGERYALLRCYSGSITVDATDSSRTRLASLTPRGELKYNITKGHIESAKLQATGTMEEASRDHLLFETRFETSPEVRLTYHCTIINTP